MIWRLAHKLFVWACNLRDPRLQDMNSGDSSNEIELFGYQKVLGKRWTQYFHWMKDEPLRSKI